MKSKVFVHLQLEGNSSDLYSQQIQQKMFFVLFTRYYLL